MSRSLISVSVGVILVVVGLYLLSASGLLSGGYSCWGLACYNTFQIMRLELWMGIGVLSTGVGSIALVGILSVRKRMKVAIQK